MTLVRTILLLIAVIIAVAVFDAYVFTANAQTVNMSPTAGALIDYAGSLLAAVLSAVGAWAIRYLNARTALVSSQTEADYAARLNDIIHRGIEYGVAAMKNEVAKPGSGISEVKFDNYFLSLAASYVNRNAPGLIAKFAITQNRLEEMITARLPGYAGMVPITGGTPATDTVKAVSRELNVPQPNTANTTGRPSVVVVPAAPETGS